MSKWMAVLALGAAFIFGSYARDAAAAAGAKGPHGKVTSIDKDTTDPKITVITIAGNKKKDPDAKDIVIKVDDSVKVTKDNDAATLADVTVGSAIAVTQDDSGKVSEIAIHTHKKKAA